MSIWNYLFHKHKNYISLFSSFLDGWSSISMVGCVTVCSSCLPAPNDGGYVYRLSAWLSVSPHAYSKSYKRIFITFLDDPEHDSFVHIFADYYWSAFDYFYWHTLLTIYDKTVINDFTTPKMRRYTTLWNNVQTLHQPMERNGKLSANELKKMWSW